MRGNFETILGALLLDCADTCRTNYFVKNEALNMAWQFVWWYVLRVYFLDALVFSTPATIASSPIDLFNIRSILVIA